MAGAFEAAVKGHGGLAVARAIEASFSLSGRPYQDIVQAAAAIAAEAAEQGTWHTGPPLFPKDDLEPEASRTAEDVTDDPVVAEPAIGQDEPPGQVAPPMGGSRAAGPVSEPSRNREQDHRPERRDLVVRADPWSPSPTIRARPTKIPARSEWQLTRPGEWQVADCICDPGIPDDDRNRTRGLKNASCPAAAGGRRLGRRLGQQHPHRPVAGDVDNPALFESIIRDLGVEIPRTWRQETGREGGGYHLLYDGRDLPERYCPGRPGRPVLGRPEGERLGRGCWRPVPDRALLHAQRDWPGQILPPPQWFAEFVIEQREKWRASLSKLGARLRTDERVLHGGRESQHQAVSLRGTLFNKVPELDDDEIEQALWAANEEFARP